MVILSLLHQWVWLGALVIAASANAEVTVDWATTLRRTNAVPTYLDQVNSAAYDRSSPIHDQAYQRINEMGADKVRYLHWDANGMTQGIESPPQGPENVSVWDFSRVDPYVIDFMNASKGHDAVVNFAAPPDWYSDPCPNPPTCTNAGYLDPTGISAGKYFSRLISWYTKGGFVDDQGRRHTSNHSFAWKFWEVLNEVDTGSSGIHCQSWNNSVTSLQCAQRYTKIFDGIVTVLKADHPEL